MNFLIIYLLSLVVMLILYWFDRENYDYQYMTYGDFVACAAWIFIPFINTLGAIGGIMVVFLTAEFWDRRPYDDFH